MLQPTLVECSDVRIATMSADALRSTPALYELLNMIFYDTAEEPRFLSVTRERNRLTLVADAEESAPCGCAGTQGVRDEE